MLQRLLIRDFVIVDRLELEFGGGFGALTGETGAGKSILVDALALALGERAEAREERMVADLSVKELRGTLLPKLNGFANYGYSRSTSEVGFLKSNQRLGPQYGLTLSVPLFRGGAIKAVKQAKLAVEQADLSLQQTQLELQRDILDTWSQSQYAGSDGVLRNTSFNNQHTLSLLGGYEYRLGKRKRVLIGIDGRVTTAGGKWYTPIDEVASQTSIFAVYETDKAFTERLKDCGTLLSRTEPWMSN